MADERAQVLDLTSLHSITVTFDLEGALGHTLGKPTRPTRRHRPSSYQTTVAGCVVGAMRRGIYGSHVFLDATYLTSLLGSPHEPGLAENIVAHELAHVDASSWATQEPWRYVSSATDVPWRHDWLRYMTLALWDEYAACRLSARIGDSTAVALNFMDCLAGRLRGGHPKLPLGSRKHWNVEAAQPRFLQVVEAARRPLLSAAYLMGHLDGLGYTPSVTTLSTPARQSPLLPCWDELHQALRLTWDDDAPWMDLAPLGRLQAVLAHAIEICGGGYILA